MNIHEYQAKALLKSYGVAVAEGVAVFDVDQAADAAAKLPGAVWVVKAQIHAGGRGKGTFKEKEAGGKGGVRIAKSAEEVRLHVQQMLHNTLVTRQTGPAGRKVERIYVEAGADIARELYLSALIDRANGRVAFIASTEGGMDIEEVARKTPEKIATFHVDPAAGYQAYVGRNVAAALGLKKQQASACVDLVRRLYAAFTEKDMSLLEINPLVVLKDGGLRVLDAKINFDDNALSRHPEIEALRDTAEDDVREVEAKKHDLSYIALDGNIGCMVNGAGLAMATMDIIKLYGGEPANFLDVGGGADKEKVTAAFKIITADPQVKGILVNIFGGIMKCDVIAEGVLAAVHEVGLKVPLVVRLEGTNVEKGKAIINESDIDAIAADDLNDAAEKIVAAVRKVEAA
jgi:succinyl-CoA synthetase beta subunit